MRARKSFDALTISDDFMFCKIMEDEGLCRIFLEMLLADKIGKITYLSSQNAIATNSEAKSIRLDVLVRDEIGKCYDIEMQVANEHNISKRMRFYQGAIDIALLDKGNSYKDLNDSYIVFICLFDPFGYNRAVYTFENMCKEDNRICLQDGARKIILNADAFQQAENPELRGFLQYVVTGEVNTEYTRRIDDMIRTIKVSEQMRKEYRILPAVIMDAIDEGLQQGLQQKAVQAARNLKQLGISIDIIVQATGLSKEEVENI